MTKLLFLALGSLATLLVGFGWHGARGRFGHHHPMTPEHAREVVSWVLRGVDASDAQIDAIADVVDEVAGELELARDRHHEQMEALAEALAAPEIDRAALEKVRAEVMALADATSARLVAAFADASAQLTPEQRAELRERHERLHAWRGHR